ncbi:MAG: 16S rRNA (guanine(966)-N(2))-methyltransferase RsmD [Burkholderiales bacterium]
MSTNRVRIIGGTWRSRLVHFPAIDALRPSPDRVRETLFNWLGQDLTGLSCLDLFAGSGVLGFEAASRGATRVVMVERDRTAVSALRENATRLGAQAVEVVQADVLACLRHETRRFDVVFMDPPFSQDLVPAVLTAVTACLADGARVYVESGRPLTAAAPWRMLREQRAGRVHFHLLDREAR